MRFPRQARIFRGQLDAAPVAGVVFLLLIFMQLSSLLYSPGVLVDLNNPGATIRVEKDGRFHFGTDFYTEAQTNLLCEALRNSPAGPPFHLKVDPAAPPRAVERARQAVNSVFMVSPAATIRVEADGRFHFGTNFYTEAQTNLLREALRNSPAGPPFDLEVDPAVPAKVAARARQAVNSMFLVRLPGGPRDLIGTDNPTVLVAVNFLGQYFYDNHIVGERELKARLREQLLAAARESKELTLTVAGDEQVNWNAVTRLAQWAREIGIKEMVLAEWPGKPPPSPGEPSP